MFKKEAENNEKDISTQKTSKTQRTRFQKKNENAYRQKSSGEKTRQRQKDFVLLIGKSLIFKLC